MWRPGSMAGVSDSASVDTMGIYLGGSVSYRVLDALRIFYDVNGFFGRGNDDIDIFAGQLGALWTITDHLSLSAGVQGWEYSAERHDDPGIDRSDLELRLRGPFVRLEFSL